MLDDQLRLSLPPEPALEHGPATGHVQQEFGGLYTVRVYVGNECVHSAHFVSGRREALRLQRELTESYGRRGASS